MLSSLDPLRKPCFALTDIDTKLESIQFRIGDFDTTKKPINMCFSAQKANTFIQTVGQNGIAISVQSDLPSLKEINTESIFIPPQFILADLSVQIQFGDQTQTLSETTLQESETQIKEQTQNMQRLSATQPNILPEVSISSIDIQKSPQSVKKCKLSGRTKY